MKKGILITSCCLVFGFSSIAFGDEPFGDKYYEKQQKLYDSIMELDRQQKEERRQRDRMPDPGTIGNPFIVTDEDGNAKGYIYSIWGKGKD